MTLHVLSHDACLAHAPPDDTPAVEVPARLGAVRDALRGWREELAWADAPRANVDELLAVHAGDQVEAVQRACKAGTWLDWDTFAVPASEEAMLRAAGAALEAARLAAAGERAFAVARPPGHHATRSRAMGFCLANNVAVAAHALTQEGHRVAVVDIDVHHGNGTQDIFYERDDVLYVSLHEHPLYPGSGAVEEAGRGPGEGFTVNLPVPAGTGHEGWLELVDRVVVPVLEGFDAHVLLVSAGFDAHRLDPLGHLALTAETFHAAVTRLCETVPRAAAVLEGGYDLGALGSSAVATAAALLGEACPVDEAPRAGGVPWARLEDRLLAVHGERWGLS